MEFASPGSFSGGGLLLGLLLLAASVHLCRSDEQNLQCVACGMPKVTPENDLIGSYGTGAGQKTYNHSCSEMYASIVDGNVSPRFLRTCPNGVKSCFGALGHYDHGDSDPTNDLEVQFLGCSEAKYKHSYGCDQEYQNVNIRDRGGNKVQVEINVNLCFCSDHTCNSPGKDLIEVHLLRAGAPRQQVQSAAAAIAVILAARLLA